ncbi:hypothetical protein DTO166G4_2810 [Paecilomyces variotii]|nr:hypothetical protein DTO166G4_2810 [Paecilomyces variotii]KAJ9233785.1 hypothetical protein DTO166G5_5541 [Paecilomyces variotii]KAJ9255164.1 hypothetical protein DTO195F2_6380 [Paecilomyces variotii]KAJ9367445.1 hypothetical protein DTO282E5_7897 [Paecilomyces variotii]
MTIYYGSAKAIFIALNLSSNITLASSPLTGGIKLNIFLGTFVRQNHIAGLPYKLSSPLRHKLGFEANFRTIGKQHQWREKYTPRERRDRWKSIIDTPRLILPSETARIPINMESKSTTEIRADLHERAKRGQALNDDEREAVIKAEASLGGEEIGRGFADEAPAPAPSQEVNPHQCAWASKADDVLSQRLDRVTKDDARDLQSKETRAFDKLPAKASLASNVQSVADQNEDTRFPELRPPPGS